MGRNKKNRWQDHYARQAKEKGWLARSVFKLEEIDRKYHLLSPRDRVLDLGCHPGSWSQYALSKVGPSGNVVGVDLNEPKGIQDPNFRFIAADVLSLDLDWLLSEVGIRDVVLSDLAPQTSGISMTILRQGGLFLCKVFEGEELPRFRGELQKRFRGIKLFRPKAVRKGSREIYVLGDKKLKF
ncbi:MAG: RlmE family RNA methyltransferase [Deltaproteobacteria bacterium]|nr:RlmE family RNA methyltransferase [Deltaproteobacteria bacterium]